MKKKLVPDLSRLDMDGGFLRFSIHWQPNPEDPDPDKPGQRLSRLDYVSLEPDEDCLCGSGKIYSDCCQPKRYWHPICLSPDMETYKLLTPQFATLSSVDGKTLRDRLMTDPRLYCTDDRMENSAWVFWGDPAWEDEFGTLCFGSIEIRENQAIVITAMSDPQMQMLLKVLNELLDRPLGTPRIEYDQVEVIDKWAYRTDPPDKKTKIRF